VKKRGRTAVGKSVNPTADEVKKLSEVLYCVSSYCGDEIVWKKYLSARQTFLLSSNSRGVVQQIQEWMPFHA